MVLDDLKTGAVALHDVVMQIEAMVADLKAGQGSGGTPDAELVPVVDAIAAATAALSALLPPPPPPPVEEPPVEELPA